MGNDQLDSWLEYNLVCPRDYNKLIQSAGNTLRCPLGHSYPIIEGIPIMLLEGVVPTQEDVFGSTLQTAKLSGASNEFGYGTNEAQLQTDAVDPYVQKVVAATCGLMYESLVNKLFEYPIPELYLPSGDGKYFLEIGCNWGRWCINASRCGYKPVGIDHNLEAVKAARRVAKQLGVSAIYLVADARYMPFPSNTFDTVFSYSVLQHFSKDNARLCLSEISRIIKTSGVYLIQMANKFGLRNLLHQLKRGFRQPADFEVRYWSPPELIKVFSELIGPATVSIDGFFSLNAHVIDKKILPLRYQFIINCSNRLQSAGQKLEWFKYFADSLFVQSIKISQ